MLTAAISGQEPIASATQKTGHDLNGSPTTPVLTGAASTNNEPACAVGSEHDNMPKNLPVTDTLDCAAALNDEIDLIPIDWGRNLAAG